MGANVYVALLRGINVGGSKNLRTKDVVALFEAAKCRDVRTYIQSGNVVFSADPEVARWVPHAVRDAIDDQFGFTVPIVLRSAAEMAQLTADNPFLKAGQPEDKLHVLFLADTPDPARVAALDPDRSPPDAFAVQGREVYLHLPNGVGRTKLTNDYFDRALGTTSTVRNWKTVGKLVEMSRT
jgi:uncharacterized protein (DUF1697 family)